MTTTISRQDDAVRAHYLVLAQSPTFGGWRGPPVRPPPPPSRGCTGGASTHQRLETEPILSIDRCRSRPRLRI